MLERFASRAAADRFVFECIEENDPQAEDLAQDGKSGVGNTHGARRMQKQHFPKFWGGAFEEYGEVFSFYYEFWG